MPSRETSVFILLFIQSHMECVPAVLLHVYGGQCLSSSVPELPSQFHRVQTDSITFCCTEMPVMMDIQMAFYIEEKYDGIHLLDVCVYWSVGVHK